MKFLLLWHLDVGKPSLDEVLPLADMSDPETVLGQGSKQS